MEGDSDTLQDRLNVSDDRINQPIDSRSSVIDDRRTLREMVAYELGAIKENQARAVLDRHDQSRLIDRMIQEIGQLTILIAREGAENRGTLLLQSREIKELRADLGGDDSGIIQRVMTLERNQDRARSIGIGIGVGAGIAGGLGGSALVGLITKLFKGG